MAIFGRLSHDRPGSGTMETSLVAVPTSLTPVSAVDSWIFQLHINNTTAGAVTFTVQDGQGTPIAALSAVGIPANQTYIASWPIGLYAKGGFSLQAGGAGMTYAAVWRQ